MSIAPWCRAWRSAVGVGRGGEGRGACDVGCADEMGGGGVEFAGVEELAAESFLRLRELDEARVGPIDLGDVESGRRLRIEGQSVGALVGKCFERVQWGGRRRRIVRAWA